MKALFSRRNTNSTNKDSSSSKLPPSSSSSSSPPNQGAGKRRIRTVSTTISLFDNNNNNKRKDDNSNGSFYAQPQDLLYPGSTTNHQSYQQPSRSSTISSSIRQTFGRSESGKKLTPVFSANGDGVGDAPKSPRPLPPVPGRQSSKGLLNTLRENGPAFLSGKGIESKSEARYGVPAQSSTHSPRDKHDSKDEAPFFVLAPRSLSTPAPRRTKTDENLPQKKALIDLRSQKSTTDQSRMANGISPDVTPRQEDVSVFAAQPSRFNGRYLDVATSQAKSTSVPNSPLFSTQMNTSPRIAQPSNDETFSLKKSIRKIKISKKGTEEGFSDEESTLADSYDYSTPPSQLLSARSAQPPSRSQDLASDLNELAVAYEEGLLGEDEYRMLRQNVFDKMMGRGEMEVPKEGRVQGRSAPNNNEVTAVSSEKATSLAPALSMHSQRSSKSNLTSLFRRGSKNDSSYQASGLTAPASSSKSAVFSTKGSITSGTSQSVRSRKSASTLLESQISNARRARTLRGHTSQYGIDGSSSSENPQLEVSASAASKKGSSLYSASGISMGGVSMSSGNALLGGNYLEKSSDEISAEIAIVEAEGKRILEGFKSLQMNAMGRYRLDFETIQRAMAGIGLESEQNMDTFDDFVMVDRTEGSDADEVDRKGNGQLLGGLIRKTKSFGQLDSLTNGQSRKGKSKGDVSVPPSSYKGVPGFPYSSIGTSPNLSPLESQFINVDEDADDQEQVEVVKLRTELGDILRRKNEVSKKYSDRLGFLKSNLRSARIREGLK